MFGPCQAALPLRFPVLRGWVWIAEARGPNPSAQPRLAPAQASPAQARSAQPSSPQPGPSLGAGLAESFAKAFLTGFRGPIFGRETAAFLARLGPPCRCVSLFWSPAQAGQPSQSLAVGLAEGSAKAFSYRIQTPFSAAITLRFWSAFGSFGAAVSLFWRFLVRVWPVSGRPVPRFEGVGLIAEARSPKPSAQPRVAPAPAHHAGHVSPAQAQLTNRKPSPARPAQVGPGQATAEPSPAQAVVCALPKLCQRLFLPDSEVPFSAAGALRFCSVFGRFGAAVPLRFAVLRGRLWGLVFGASPAQASEPSPAQPSPAQPSPSLGVGLAKPLPKPFLTGFRCRILIGGTNGTDRGRSPT